MQDFTVYRYWSIVWLLCANTPRAELWIIDNVLKKGFQPRWPQMTFVGDGSVNLILEMITRDGLTWEAGE